MRLAEDVFPTRFGSPHKLQRLIKPAHCMEGNGKALAGLKNVIMFPAKDALANSQNLAVFTLRLGIFALIGKRAGQIIAALQGIGILRTKDTHADCKHGAVLLLRLGVFAPDPQDIGQNIPGLQSFGMLRAKQALVHGQRRTMFPLVAGGTELVCKRHTSEFQIECAVCT